MKRINLMDAARLSLGTQMPWGKIMAIGTIGSECYYWMVDEKPGLVPSVAMMPASVVEPATPNTEVRDPHASSPHP